MSLGSARVLGGRYQLHTMLGRGGMATVWAGVDTRLGRPVAVKLLDGPGLADPVMAQRLDREAQAVARLTHPNIVAVYDVGREANGPYVVMELVDGDDLEKRLAHGRLDIGVASAIARQTCDGLDAAHRAGVVHRDIKPGNILLTAAGVAKICDFGIARWQQSSQVRVTGLANTVGTSEYMAPEQAEAGEVDGRTDLYALGCVLYRMLAGRPPFSGENPMQVLWQQVHQPPTPVSALRPDIPGELDALVTRLLAKNPADRPTTASEVRAYLARLSDVVAVDERVTGLVPVDNRPARARAPVVVGTQVMPALEATGAKAPSRGGFRLGPVGVTAVAVGAATATALAIALAMATQSAPSGSPLAGSTTPPVTSTTSTTPATKASGEAGTVDATRAAVARQASAGGLAAKAANDLGRRLAQIDQLLRHNQQDKAADKVRDLLKKLAELRDDGRITEAGYQEIVTSLEQLAGTLSEVENNDGD